MVGFMMSMVAMKMSLRPASKELTFGWHRAEIIGTMTSVIFLLTLTIWLVFEATGRVVDPQEVKGLEMAITAVMGLFFNLIQMKILHQGEGGYHMGAKAGAGCTHDHGEEGHAHEGGHAHVHGKGCDHSHDKPQDDGHGHSHDHGPKKDENK
jgi:zinc transporter 2